MRNTSAIAIKKYVNVVVMAIEMPDGSIVTGRSSRRMVAAGAAVLNAIKKLAGIPDDLYMIAPNVSAVFRASRAIFCIMTGQVSIWKKF